MKRSECRMVCGERSGSVEPRLVRRDAERSADRIHVLNVRSARAPLRACDFIVLITLRVMNELPKTRVFGGFVITRSVMSTKVTASPLRGEPLSLPASILADAVKKPGRAKVHSRAFEHGRRHHLHLFLSVFRFFEPVLSDFFIGSSWLDDNGVAHVVH